MDGFAFLGTSQASIPFIEGLYLITDTRIDIKVTFNHGEIWHECKLRVDHWVSVRSGIFYLQSPFMTTGPPHRHTLDLPPPAGHNLILMMILHLLIHGGHRRKPVLISSFPKTFFQKK